MCDAEHPRHEESLTAVKVRGKKEVPVPLRAVIQHNDHICSSSNLRETRLSTKNVNLHYFDLLTPRNVAG